MRTIIYHYGLCNSLYSTDFISKFLISSAVEKYAKKVILNLTLVRVYKKRKQNILRSVLVPI